MEVEYKRIDHKSCLIIKDVSNIKGDDILYLRNMLVENHVPGLLPLDVNTFDGDWEFYYDISGKQTMDIMFEKKKLLKKDLTALFDQLYKTMAIMEEYLLDLDGLMLKSDYIYYSLGAAEYAFLYCPTEQYLGEDAVYDLAEYILSHSDNEDSETILYAYSFYRYVKEELGDLLAALNRLRTEFKETDEAPGIDMPPRENAQGEMRGWQEDVSVGVGFQKAGMDGQSARVMAERGNDAMEDGGGYMENGISWEDPYASGGLSPWENDLATPTFEEDTTSTPERIRNNLIRRGFFALLGLFGAGFFVYGVWLYGLDAASFFTVKETVVGAGILCGAVFAFFFSEYLCKKRLAEEDAEANPSAGGMQGQGLSEWGGMMEEPEEDSDWEMPEGANDFKTVLLQENCYSEQRILVGKVKGHKKEIDLAAFPFLIGKDKAQADFVIDDSSVSRLHARFTLRDDVVYLTDLNSTNGTIKNGIRLEPNEQVMLEASDEIKFGKVSFVYY